MFTYHQIGCDAPNVSFWYTKEDWGWQGVVLKLQIQLQLVHLYDTQWQLYKQEDDQLVGPHQHYQQACD
jgi:hypothetical protein